MYKLLGAFLLWPFFLIGLMCNVIWNGFMTGWCFQDSLMNPEAWKIMYGFNPKRGED